jgi:hypothetical protein
MLCKSENRHYQRLNDRALNPKRAKWRYRLQKIFNAIPFVNAKHYYFLAMPTQYLPAIPKGFAWSIVENPNTLNYDWGAPPAICAQRIQVGAICLAVYKNNSESELTAQNYRGVLWLVPNMFPEDEAPLVYHYGQDYCWDMGLYIPPDFRMTRAFQALWGGASEYMQAKGYKASLSRVSSYNLASLRPHLAMGGYLYSDVFALSIFGLTYGISPLSTKPCAYRAPVSLAVSPREIF